MQDSSPILEINEVVKSFGSLEVLLGVSFQVTPGEILGIAGPNGAGKTTLFNLISGMLPVSAGKILFKSEEITNLKPHRICNLGISRTFQTPVVFPKLSVKENIRVGATFGKKNKKFEIEESITEVLEKLEISHLKESSAENLSLYDKKLVMLGTVLAAGPALLMLDEPCAGLTHNEIENFMELVKKLNERDGITVMIIEHLIDWLRFVSEKMLIIHNGVVLAYGSPDAVVQDKNVIDVYIGRTGD